MAHPYHHALSLGPSGRDRTGTVETLNGLADGQSLDPRSVRSVPPRQFPDRIAGAPLSGLLSSGAVRVSRTYLGRWFSTPSARAGVSARLTSGTLFGSRRP